MPLKGKATKVMKSMKKQYGDDAESVFYATANKQGRTPETWNKKESSVKTAQALSRGIVKLSAGERKKKKRGFWGSLGVGAGRGALAGLTAGGIGGATLGGLGGTATGAASGGPAGAALGAPVGVLGGGVLGGAYGATLGAGAGAILQYLIDRSKRDSEAGYV